MRAFGNDKIGHRLTFELGAHADALGMSFAGHSRLSGLVHCTRDSIHAKLIELSEMDYIRCHYTQTRTRAKAEITYQLSPYVLYIRDELLDEAWRLWKEGKPYLEVFEMVNNGENVILEHQNVMLVQQPAIFNQRKPSTTQSSNQRPNQTDPSNMESQNPKNRATKKANGASEQHAKGETQATAIVHNGTHSDSQTHAEGEQQKIPPVSALPPMNKPLGDAEMELVAQMLRVFGGGTNIQTARMLVHTHGCVRVREAIAKARAKASDNPIGYVIGTLKAQATENPPLTSEQVAQREAEDILLEKWRRRQTEIDNREKTDDPPY
jgi:hypothetical protein